MPIRWMAIVALCLGVAAIPVMMAAAKEAPQAPCTCQSAKLDNGRCDRHELGYVASIPIRSRMLYETLDAHGHTLDPNAFVCEMCREAIRSDGFCERDRIGFVNTQAYFSRLSYEL